MIDLEKITNWVFVIVFSFVIVGFIIVISGCSQRTEYIEKNMPIKCAISTTQAPPKTGVLEKDIANILIYAEIIEKDLKFCTGRDE